ncbi:tyrosine-type recombinase/integrase [Actinoplanes derwentensis]|uniref:Site-specific recombinase XerD n=1 Tax=Actinoplanes derwentensis TaxID=113562 RepID=A0A1H1VS89_9ACTN|nr:tyrosine-type recombinase/integrase [Actinoplanes derwentensis]GID83601.1 tyrosine recombinase XerD [Actinoplanes derwentensis]SDS87602.1 Site-specific recombinase XerD [Actinoplanes derwentensis]
MRRVDEVSDWLIVSEVSTSAPNTIKSQAQALAQWWRWCLGIGADPLTVDAVTFARFVAALQTVPKDLPLTSKVVALPGDPRLRRPSTVSQRVVHIKGFYRWAMHNGRVSAVAGRAVTGFKTPAAPQTMRARRLRPEQVTALLTVNLSPRDRWMVELLYGAGLREGEALGLRVEDWCIGPEVAAVFGCRVYGGPHLHVRRRRNSNGAWAKSPCERVVPIAPRVLQAYRDWQAWAFDHAPESMESPYLTISLAGPTRGRAWSISGFTSMWQTKVRTIPGLEEVTPHLLRHEWASELLDAGAPAFTVQELLGHRSPTSTQIYTHARMDTLTAAVAQLATWRQRLLGIAG